jgi:hypothetical protein
MPTEPLKNVLDPHFAVANAAGVISRACPLLRELVNNGTHVFRRCESEASPLARTDPSLLVRSDPIEEQDFVQVCVR